MASDAPEPWGPRLWCALGLALLAAVVLLSYGIGSWPMADDEVPSLVEMGLVDIPPSTFSVPPDQVGRLARTNPVWYAAQAFLIGLLPAGEAYYRLPSLLWALLTVALVFVAASRTIGLSAALAAMVVLLGSVPFVFLSQVNRFYSLPLLLVTLTVVTIWWPRPAWWTWPLVAALAVVTVLSHNLTMVVFVLALLASLSAVVVTPVPRDVIVRSAIAAGIGLALYVFYIRPLVSGWHSTGNPTPVLVSFAAQAGIPTLALAGLGAWLAMMQRRDVPALVWSGLMLAGSFCVFLLADINWNPRYFVFFMPVMWALAAWAVAAVARALGGWPVRIGWYGCVALLMAPGLLSHFQDGSRHDYRAAARVLAAQAAAGQPILSDDAETISYYLPDDLRNRLQVRTKVRVPPESEYFLVTRANVWMPLPAVPNRRMHLLAEIAQRRYDQFSHILRVYRVAPAERP